MADDQNKTSTIDDLVKELSKNNNPNQSESLSDKPMANQGSDTSRYPTSPASDGAGPTSSASSAGSAGPPPNLPGIKVEPKSESSLTRPSVPPSPQMPPRPQTPQPSAPSQPQPNLTRPTSTSMPSGPSGPIGISKPPVQPSPPPVTSQLKPSPLQEYKSSIRTMGEDIASLKSGQKPSGVDIPRRVAPEAPKAPLPGAPAAPAPLGPMSSVGLGKTEKTGPLAGLPKPPTLPGRPGPTIGLGQAGKTGPLSPPSTAGPLKTPEIQSSITVPKERKGPSMSLYLIIAGVLVAGGSLYWFYLRPTEPEVVLSPTPTATPTPAVRNLNDIFAGVPTNFKVSLSNNISGDFKTFVNTLTVANGDFLKINLVQDVDSTLVPLNWLDMFDMALTVYPSGLRDNIVDSATVVYGQSEMFNEDGAIDFSAQGLKKTVFVAKVTNATGVATMTKGWESTIAEDLGGYLIIEDTSKAEGVNFLDNTYRGVAIRYKNFPFPDITVDYAVISTADQNYLVIAGSREAMFATIDVLLKQ